MDRTVKNLKGQRFGRLTVLSFHGIERKHAAWLCRCVCGKKITAIGCNLTRGSVKSCGCLRRELQRDKAKLSAAVITTHGHTLGGKQTSEYVTWGSMITRCTNPNAENYERYGGRGIKVCNRWRKFANFLADMGLKPTPQHTIDRIDSDGNYTKRNCRWATKSQQNLNSRRSKRNAV